MSEQQHHFAESLKRGTATSAHWAVSLPRSILVFVHGFCGHAISTWVSFPEMLLADPRTIQTDIVFYGYDGKTRQAGNSSLELLTFLRDVATRPWALSSSGIGRSRADPPYERIVVAAHSLGAVVTRRALLDAARVGDAWLERVRFVLFAPAHNGAYAAVLASAFVSEQDWFLGKLAGAVAQYNIPLIEDLKPDSVVLRRLQDDTRTALGPLLAEDPGASPSHLVARAVVWANDDKVVINQPFQCDPLPVLWDGDHSRVCKPHLGFVDPLDIVIKELDL